MIDERSASSAARSPLSFDDSDPLTTISVLQRDNETLRSMLRRALGPASSRLEQGVSTATHHLQSQLAKRDDECRRERERRTIAESLVAELRHDRDMSLKAKDADIRKLQDAVTHLKSENSALQKRTTDDRHVIDILKKENHRLLELTQKKGVPSGANTSAAAMGGGPRGGPSYATLVRPERLKADVPSAKHMNPLVVKRSFLPSAGVGGLRSTSPCPSTTPSTTQRKASAAAAGGATRGAVKDAHPLAVPNRPKSAGSSVAGGCGVRARTAKEAATTYEVGQRCTWHRMQGVVRYVGPVQGLGRGMFVGVELLIRGSGDHDGMLCGIQYFNAAPRSAVFCVPSELQPPSDSRTSTPKRTANSGGTTRSGIQRNAMRGAGEDGVIVTPTATTPIKNGSDVALDASLMQHDGMAQPVVHEALDADGCDGATAETDEDIGGGTTTAEAETANVPMDVAGGQPLDEREGAINSCDSAHQHQQGVDVVVVLDAATPVALIDEPPAAPCDAVESNTAPVDASEDVTPPVDQDAKKPQKDSDGDGGSLVRTDDEDVRFPFTSEGATAADTDAPQCNE